MVARAVTRYRHLTELAFAYLEGEGAPRSAGAVAGRLFATPATPAGGGTGTAAGPFVRIVDELLGGDGRFARDAAGCWGLAGWERAQDSLAGARFAVIDVETAGGGPAAGPLGAGRERGWGAGRERGRPGRRVLEVAVVLVDGGAVSGRFASLLNPERPVPATVSELTGITQEMADEAPPGAEVLPEVLSLIGDRVVVGHNVGADLAALNYEALWHGLPPVGNATLDTEALALRLLPDLRRPSLARVAGALGLASPQRHRALADAQLTAAVLHHLLALLPASASGGGGIDTVSELLAWLSGTPDGRKTAARRPTASLPPETLRDLPEAPGVYHFRDAAGETLYVGKAASLRARVAQHFGGTARALRRHEGLLERTASITHETVACELDALLLESARIRSLQPPYNVQARSRRGAPFLRLEPGPFPRAGATTLPPPDAPCAGPYRTAQQVRHTLATLRRVFQIRPCRRRLPATRAKLRIPCLRLGQGLCPAPCAGAVAPEAYATLVDFAWLFVTRGREATLAALDARLTMLEAGQAGGLSGEALWETGVLRDCRARLRRLRREYRPVEGGLAGEALVMVYPTAPGAVLFFVRDGKLRGRVVLLRHALNASALAPVIAAVLAAPPDGPVDGRDSPLDADQQHILLRWIYRRSGGRECVPAPPDACPETLAGAVLEALNGPA